MQRKPSHDGHAADGAIQATARQCLSSAADSPGCWRCRTGPVQCAGDELLDRNVYSTFQPLLYQVATAGLTSADVAYPLWSATGRRGARFRKGELVGLDLSRRSRDAGLRRRARL